MILLIATGHNRPAIVPIPFEIPISILAYLGAISKWFTLKPATRVSFWSSHSLGTKVRLGTLDSVYIMLYYIGIVTGNGESTERYAAGQRYRGCKGSMSRGQHEEKCSFHPETAAVEYLSNASRGKCAGFS